MPTDIPGERNMVNWDKKQRDVSQRNKKIPVGGTCRYTYVIQVSQKLKYD